MLIRGTKKALNLSAFFIVATFTGSLFYSAIASANCAVKNFDEAVSVSWVTDGDTLVLTDKRKIRLIGINTPELARYPKRAEVFSMQAKRFVEAALRPTKKVYIKYGLQRKDRYGRVLAHLFLKNGQNLNAMLLENGLASAVVVPPNAALADCYFKTEATAKNNKRNIWAHAYSQPIDAAKLAITKTGFQFIKGKVIRVGRSRDSIWLQLAKNFTIRIKRRDFKNFPQLDLENLTLAHLKNKTLYARGWIYKWKNALYLQVRHAYMIQL